MKLVEPLPYRKGDIVDQFETTGVSDMPSTTPKQKRTMRAAEHNPAFRKKMHIPLKVAKEFNRADARKGKRK